MAWDFVLCDGTGCFSLVKNAPHYHFKDSGTGEDTHAVFSKKAAIEILEYLSFKDGLDPHVQFELLKQIALADLPVEKTSHDKELRAMEMEVIWYHMMDQPNSKQAVLAYNLLRQNYEFN